MSNEKPDWMKKLELCRALADELEGEKGEFAQKMMASWRPILEHIQALEAENERLRRFYNAAKAVDDKGQFCWEFSDLDVFYEFVDAFEALSERSAK